MAMALGHILASYSIEALVSGAQANITRGPCCAILAVEKETRMARPYTVLAIDIISGYCVDVLRGGLVTRQMVRVEGAL